MIIHQTQSEEFKILRRKEMDPQTTRSSLITFIEYVTRAGLCPSCFTWIESFHSRNSTVRSVLMTSILDDEIWTKRAKPTKVTWLGSGETEAWPRV